ncbi:SDR family oxidoreductase [Rhizobium sp. BK376]|uniref:SDR family oxidoreductase n=1 Tax=Rhizobium sp. BK376 TaxID=2512149 RepID=UPI00247AF43D|nr:SDR family oxidoreductase [Rhizobium sp. BK376]
MKSLIKNLVENRLPKIEHHRGFCNRAFERVIKWAMEGFSRCMALEFAAHGIRVNTLCPTFTETPMTTPQAPATSSSFMPSMYSPRIVQLGGGKPCAAIWWQGRPYP